MPYYEFQWLVDDLQEILEEQTKNNKSTNSQNDATKQAKHMQQNAMQQQQAMMKNMTSSFGHGSGIPMPTGAFDFLK